MNKINLQYMNWINNMNGPTYRSISLDGALDIVSSVLRFSEREDIEWVVVIENSEEIPRRKFDCTFILNPDIMMFSDFIITWLF